MCRGRGWRMGKCGEDGEWGNVERMENGELWRGWRERMGEGMEGGDGGEGMEGGDGGEGMEGGDGGGDGGRGWGRSCCNGV